MKFEISDSEVETEGFSQTASFSIAASGKAFKGLIDGLYSRKIEAAIRELATNAYDAHVAARNPEPFNIQLPSVVDPVFSIRDYGTGMSHQLMMVRYTTMFDSTKDGLVAEDCEVVGANEQVGMLGLGSKAFFAYTDSCTITVWMDGEVRYYSVYMGDDGIPKISLAGQAASDEPRGVKVEFAVSTKDLENFETSAIRVLKGFPYLPTGLRSDIVAKVEGTPYQTGAFWNIYEKGYLPGDNTLWARQGCVLYPVNLELVDDKCVVPEKSRYNAKTTFSPEFAPFNDVNGVMVMDFPIGTIEFDLSRENLAYTSKTIAGVKARLAYMVESMDAEFAPLYSGCKNGWERFQLSAKLGWMGSLFYRTKWYQEYVNIAAFIHQSMPGDNNDRTWKPGLFHADLLFKMSEEEFDACRQLEEDPQHWANGNTAQTVYTRKERGSFSQDFHRLVLFESDASKTLTNRRCYYHMFKHGYLRGFIFRRDVQITPAIRKALGNPKIVKVSETEVAPKVASAFGWSGDAPPPFERFKIEVDGYYEGIDMDDGPDPDYVYLFMNRGKIWNPNRGDGDIDLSYSTLKNIEPFLKKQFGKELVYINIRSNEFTKAVERWAEYPLLYDLLPKMENLIEKKYKPAIIRHTNNRRFMASKHRQFIDAWRATFGLQVIDEPIKALMKYWKLVELPFEARYAPFSNVVNRIIQQAETEGKLLPEEDLALLPAPWLGVQDVVLRNSRMHEEDKKMFFSILREQAQKEMQCN